LSLLTFRVSHQVKLLWLHR